MPILLAVGLFAIAMLCMLLAQVGNVEDTDNDN